MCKDAINRNIIDNIWPAKTLFVILMNSFDVEGCDQ